ncbi:MAG: hypothetical protein RL069_1265, partial [Planctomycetota bacterium]
PMGISDRVAIPLNVLLSCFHLTNCDFKILDTVEVSLGAARATSNHSAISAICRHSNLKNPY